MTKHDAIMEASVALQVALGHALTAWNRLNQEMTTSAVVCAYCQEEFPDMPTVQQHNQTCPHRPVPTMQEIMRSPEVQKLVESYIGAAKALQQEYDAFAELRDDGLTTEDYEIVKPFLGDKNNDRE